MPLLLVHVRGVDNVTLSIKLYVMRCTAQTLKKTIWQGPRQLHQAWVGSCILLRLRICRFICVGFHLLKRNASFLQYYTKVGILYRRNKSDPHDTNVWYSQYIYVHGGISEMRNGYSCSDIRNCCDVTSLSDSLSSKLSICCYLVTRMYVKIGT
jgi:hypothetical protein